MDTQAIEVLGKLGIEIVAFLILYFTVLHKQMKEMKETLKEMSQAMIKLDKDEIKCRGETQLSLRERPTWDDTEKEIKKAMEGHSSSCPVAIKFSD